MTPPPSTPTRKTTSRINDLQASSSSSTKIVTRKRDSTVVSGDHACTGAQPVFAYARQTRCSASPLRGFHGSRYILTFNDAGIAEQWWMLIRARYPEMTRHGPKLFSFQSEGLLQRAHEDKRFAHLRGEWEYELIEDKKKSEVTPVGKAMEKPVKPGKRASLMRMISAPSLGHAREAFRENCNDVRHSEDDPFTEKLPPTPPIDLNEVNRTLDRMQMMMNQTQLRIDVLAERQQMHAESVSRLQGMLEANATHVQALATEHQVSAKVTRNLRSSIEVNAAQIRIVLEKQKNDADRAKNVDQKIRPCIEAVSDMMRERRVDEKMEMAKVDQHEAMAQKMDSLMGALRITGERLDSITATVRIEAASMDKHIPSGSFAEMVVLDKHDSLRTMDVQTSTTPKAGLGSPQTADEFLGPALQHALDGHADKITESVAAANIKAASKLSRKISSALAAQDQAWTQRLDALQAFHEQALVRMREEMQAHTETQLSRLQSAHEAGIARVLEAIEESDGAQAGQVALPVQCGHHVAPPPRKMNREVLGYWYK